MLWVFFAVFILGTFMWTVQILLRQKSVWEQFSKRYSLEFSRNALLKSPSLKGMFRDMYISVFSTEIEENNRSARKYRTVIQFDMKPGVPTEGIIASPGYRNFALGLGISRDYVPAAPDWNRGILIRCEEPEKLESYLTPERVKAINALFSIKNSGAVLIFTPSETFFRFDTADPLDEISRCEKFITKVVDAAKILDPIQTA